MKYTDKSKFNLLSIGIAVLYLVSPSNLASFLIFILVLLLAMSENLYINSRAKNSVWFVFLFFLLAPSLLLELPEVARRIFFVTPILLVLLLGKSIDFTKIVNRVAPYSIFAFLGFRFYLYLTKIYCPIILTTLGLGYDNSHHFAMFKSVLHTDQLSRYSINGPWAIPSWFAEHYPVGNQIIWGALLAPLRLQNSTLEESIGLFALTIIVSLAGIILFASRMIINSSEIKSRLQASLVALFVSIIIAFGSFGYVVNSGFPPLLSGCLFLGGLLLIGGKHYSRFASVIQIICVALIALTYVTLAIPAALSLMFLKITQLRRGVAHKPKKEVCILGAAAVTILAITFKIFQVTAGTMGWRQILADGGIEDLPREVIVLSIVVTIIFSAIAFKRTSIMRASAVLIGANWLVYFAISITTIHFKGSVSYYAQKQGYVAIAFTVVAALVIAIESLRSLKLALRITGLNIVVLFMLFQFNFATHPITFNSGFMSSIPIATKYMIDSDSRNQQLINGTQLLRAHYLTQSASMTLVLNSNNDIDLTSRWMNAINHTWTDKTWFFYNPVSTWNNRPEFFVDLIDSTKTPVVVTDDISSIDIALREFLTGVGFNFIEVARK